MCSVDRQRWRQTRRLRQRPYQPHSERQGQSEGTERQPARDGIQALSHQQHPVESYHMPVSQARFGERSAFGCSRLPLVLVAAGSAHWPPPLHAAHPGIPRSMLRMQVLIGSTCSMQENSRGPSRVAHLQSEKVAMPLRIASPCLHDADPSTHPQTKARCSSPSRPSV